MTLKDSELRDIAAAIARPYVVITGNPVDGFFATGPFANIDEAHRWAEINTDGEWWPMVLEGPRDNELPEDK